MSSILKPNEDLQFRMAELLEQIVICVGPVTRIFLYYIINATCQSMYLFVGIFLTNFYPVVI
jgi:hypothetical protein